MKPTPHVTDMEARKQRRLRALGTNEPHCAMCGEDRWQALEAHHVAGQTHDATTVVLCRNCHDVASDAQRDQPDKQENSDPRLETIGRFLLGLADLLRIAAERLSEFGRYLIAHTAADTGRKPP